MGDEAERSQEQVLRERAMAAVSDVLFNLEGTLAHAKKALVRTEKEQAGSNAALALAEVVRELERVRKRLMLDTYFAVDERLI